MTLIRLLSQARRVYSRSLLVSALVGVSSLAYAQEQVNGFDYYAPRTTNADITRLKNVEQYHIGPGQEKMAKRQWNYAQQDFEFILRYYPNHPQALSLMSALCQKWGDRRCNADDWFEKATKLNPNAAPTFLLHGMHLHRKQQLPDAVKAYQRAVELAPNSVDAHYNLGLALVELKQYDLANQHAQRSYQLGAYLPGLRNKLQQAGRWNPNAAAAPVAATAPAGAPAAASTAAAPEASTPVAEQSAK